MAFQHTSDAVHWCMEAQRALVDLGWPAALLEHPGAAEEWNDSDDVVLYKGLRVRMGVHVGEARTRRDAMTRRVEYSGPVVNAAARITAMTHGGQVSLIPPHLSHLTSSPLHCLTVALLDAFWTPRSSCRTWHTPS
jgi:class 3 adenylate cyclase